MKEAGNIKWQFLFPRVKPLPLLRNHPRPFRPAREIPHALARTARDSAPDLAWGRSARRLSLGFEVSPARSAACIKRRERDAREVKGLSKYESGRSVRKSTSEER